MFRRLLKRFSTAREDGRGDNYSRASPLLVNDTVKGAHNFNTDRVGGAVPLALYEKQKASEICSVGCKYVEPTIASRRGKFDIKARTR